LAVSNRVAMRGPWQEALPHTWGRAGIERPREATRTRLSMAATPARLLRNAGTFENWSGKRASCSYR
jgi:hypothetical protein